MTKSGCSADWAGKGLLFIISDFSAQRWHALCGREERRRPAAANSTSKAMRNDGKFFKSVVMERQDGNTLRCSRRMLFVGDGMQRRPGVLKEGCNYSVL